MAASSTNPLSFLVRPIHFFRNYNAADLRPDLLAGVTVSVIVLPQAIAYALIAELPPEMGLYAAVVGGVVGALWGSSRQAHTGPTNAISLLVLSSLMVAAEPGTLRFQVAAGLLAVMVGAFQLIMGMGRLGVLVNFVSHSVIIGFAGGAGVLIAVTQIRHLLGLELASRDLIPVLREITIGLQDTHLATAVLGILTMVIVVALARLNPKLPGNLIGIVVASVVVFLLGLEQEGVAVIGTLPSGLPPLAHLPWFDLELVAQLSTGALAVGAIGLVETSAISRSIATRTGQRLNSNQEFVGQGLANLATGIFSGYPCAGSFSRSAVNFTAGARSGMSAVFSALFVLVAMFFLLPLAAYLPRTALAGVLIITGIGMIDRKEIVRVYRGARADAAILTLTFLGTLFLHIEFAVLAGILLSFAVYIVNTSVPKVHWMLPDDSFRHFLPRPDRPSCPQLGIVEIQGDLYFGAVSHVERAVYDHQEACPEERYLLLRMRSVNQCDFSGIHALETIVQSYRDRGGEVFVTGVQQAVTDLMESTGFCDYLGRDRFLSSESSVDFLFHRILDPTICIYECPVRAFRECQNLPKREYPVEVRLQVEVSPDAVQGVAPRELWDDLHRDGPPLIVDVREAREFKGGHIPEALHLPLPTLLSAPDQLPHGRMLVFVCRGGRRSLRAAYAMQQKGFSSVAVLQGGMLAWERSGLLEAVG